jgi:hypothetical protein
VCARKATKGNEQSDSGFWKVITFEIRYEIVIFELLLLFSKMRIRPSPKAARKQLPEELELKVSPLHDPASQKDIDIQSLYSEATEIEVFFF